MRCFGLKWLLKGRFFGFRKKGFPQISLNTQMYYVLLQRHLRILRENSLTPQSSASHNST